MSIALYFAKVNLVSHQINEVLEARIPFRPILQSVMNSIENGLVYKYDRPIKVDGEFHTEKIEYSISIRDKKDDVIEGFLYKKSFIHYKTYNESTKELDSKKITSTEGVLFYYDVFREMVAYQRTLRFGYKEVLNAFEGIINLACEKANLGYKFTVCQYTEGLDLDQLKHDMLEPGEVQRLNVRYQIPNPESDILEEIKNNPEKTIADFKEANLTTKTVIYQSNGIHGLNIDSRIIEQELNNISSMHSHIDAKRAIQNGYVVVETTNINGLKRSSAETHPLTKKIEDLSEFREAASATILSRVAHEIAINQ